MRVKRLFDLAASLLGLGITAPVLACIAVIIRVDDGGPVFFRQQRVGRRGREFAIWKFRTMTAGAEQRGRPLTVGADPRITRVGRWLRHTKLDELPQLFNVVRGDMSIVGPRPEVPRYVGMYTPEQRRVLELLPGITDPASIEYRNEAAVLAASDDPERTYVDEIMPRKIRLNLEYAEARRGIGSDLGIVLKTLAAIVRP